MANRKPQSYNLLDIGKIPPQAIDLEVAILGACMVEQNAINEISDLQPHHFYKEQHSTVFSAMKKLKSDGKPIDMLMVVEQLSKDGSLELAGGAYAISQITNAVGSAANIRHHAFIVLEKYELRKQIEISLNVIQSAYEQTDDVASERKRLFAELDTEMSNISDVSMAATWDEFEANMIHRIGNKLHIMGIESGYADLDRVVGGFRKGEVIILAAQPGVGKTAFSIQLAINCAVKKKIPCGYFSLEMSMAMLQTRIAANLSGIDSNKVRDARLEPPEHELFTRAVGAVRDAPFYIYDRSASIHKIADTARKWKLKHNIQMLFIDYLQKVMPSDKRAVREQQVADISREIQNLAKELDIPIMAISSLNRGTAHTADKIPQLSDLRESGSIESDARVVIFLYRPEYVGQQRDGENIVGLCEAIVAKNNNGAMGTAQLKFVGHTQRFYDWNDFTPAHKSEPEYKPLKPPAPF